MKAYFVQHGEAVPEDVDPKRPLSENGRHYTGAVAGALVLSGLVNIEKIFHSGKLRAKQTAELFAAALGIPDKVTELQGIGPMDDTTACISALEAESWNVMVVGHLPHLDKVVSELLCGEGCTNVASFKFSGIICLERKNHKAWAVAPLFD